MSWFSPHLRVRSAVFALIVFLMVGAAWSTTTRTAHAQPLVPLDGSTRVTSYFCPPNCGGERWTGEAPQAGYTAACASAHAMQYVHLTYIGLTLRCTDYGSPGYFERGDEPVDVYGMWLGTYFNGVWSIEDYDYVWYSDWP